MYANSALSNYWPNPPVVTDGYGASDDTRSGEASNVTAAYLYKHNTQKRTTPPVEEMGAIEPRLYVFRLIHCLRGGVWKRRKFGLWGGKQRESGCRRHPGRHNWREAAEGA